MFLYSGFLSIFIDITNQDLSREVMKGIWHPLSSIKEINSVQEPNEYDKIINIISKETEVQLAS